MISGNRPMKAWRIALVLLSAALARGNSAIAQTPQAETNFDNNPVIDATTIDAALGRMKPSKKEDFDEHLADREAYFGIGEIGWLKPTLVGRRFSPSSDATNSLDWALSPRITLGVELWEDSRWQVSYQFLIASGPEHLAAFTSFGAPTNVQFLSRPRVEMHWLDLDGQGFPLTYEDVSLMWSVGARLAALETSTSFLTPAPDRARDVFAGVGLHVGCDGKWNVGKTGFSVFAGAQVAILAGVDAFFSDDNQSNDTTLYGTTPEGSYRRTDDALLATGHFEAGAGWSGHFGKSLLILSAAYQFEWWQFFAATVNEPLQPTVHLGNDVLVRSQGALVRCELRF
jgi:hypothetical protein